MVASSLVEKGMNYLALYISKLVATLKVHTWHNMPFISGFGDLFLVTYVVVRMQKSIMSTN